MIYTVGEIAKKLGIPPSTLRYYDQEGLLPFVERSESGVRVFKEADCEWLRVIECLKKTGMKLKDIKLFVEMAMRGDETIAPRLALIVRQKEAVKARIAELEETLRTLEFKEWYYETAQKSGSTDIPKNMTLDEIPPTLRAVRMELRGE